MRARYTLYSEWRTTRPSIEVDGLPFSRPHDYRSFSEQIQIDGVPLDLAVDRRLAQADHRGRIADVSPRLPERFLDRLLLHLVHEAQRIDARRFRQREVELGRRDDAGFREFGRGRCLRRWNHLGLHFLPQHLGADFGRGAEDRHPLDQVFQLPDVAGPIVLRHLGQRLGREVEVDPAVVQGRPLQEAAGQLGNVFLPLPQRRHPDGDDVQPVVEVLAELSLADPVEQVAVGRRHDAHVDLDPLGATDSLDSPLLQEAQDLGLEDDVHLADFVQEERPPRRPRSSGRSRKAVRLVGRRCRTRPPRPSERSANQSVGVGPSTLTPLAPNSLPSPPTSSSLPCSQSLKGFLFWDASQSFAVHIWKRIQHHYDSEECLQDFMCTHADIPFPTPCAHSSTLTPSYSFSF